MDAHRTSQIKFQVAGLLVALALVAAWVVLWPGQVALARPAVLSVATDSGASLVIMPSSLPLSIGGTGAITLEVRDVTNLYGVEFHLTFNPNFVQVEDADPTLPGVQIGVGALFRGAQVAIAQ